MRKTQEEKIFHFMYMVCKKGLGTTDCFVLDAFKIKHRLSKHELNFIQYVKMYKIFLKTSIA
jgi:hypothetical protein